MASSTSQEQAKEVICEEYAKVLGFDVDPEDSFLELGGVSLLATKAVSRINQRLNVKLNVGDIFECPVVLDLVERISQSEQSSTYTTIPHLDDGSDTFQQSFAQGRLWFMDRLYPDSPIYLMPFATRLRGPLNIFALNQAISALEQRHETLRTTFELQDDIGVQVVHPFKQKDIKVVDLTEHTTNPWQYIEQEQTTTFNLENEKLWRVTIFKLGEDDHVLSIVIHHIVCDGWSIDLMRHELETLYSAALDGKDEILGQLDPLPIQYRDFAVWQRQPERDAEYEKQLSYWSKQLDGSRPAQLFCDKPRPAVFSGRADEIDIKFDQKIVDNLQTFCKDRQATPFAVLLAAFRATHYRLTGADDATIGIPIANRNRQELEGLIGFFTNVQCVRLRVQEDSFASLVQQTNTTTYAAFANQDVSFEKVVAALQPEDANDSSRHPLVQLLFALHDQPSLGEFTLESIASERLKLSKISRLDFEFHIYKDGDGLNATVHYALDLFDEKTIQNVIANFFDVLSAGLDAPETPVAQLPLGRAVSSLRDINRFDIEQTPYPRDSSLVDVFEEQVKICPDKVAVKDPSKSLTYVQLDQDSDRLCRWLIKQDFPLEGLVGVLAPRSCETIVAFFGILKASLAYVPFDLKTPASRIDTIMESFTGPKLLLIGSEMSPPAVTRGDITCKSIGQALEEQKLTEEADSTSTPVMPPKPSAMNLAYVMFTSGSTGKPKGVMVEHRPVVRMMKNTEITVSKSFADGTVAHMTGLAFDVSGWEIYHALLNGGTLVCIDIMTVLDGDALHRIFKTEKIRVVVTSPAVLKQIVQDNPDTVSDVHDVYVIGDVFRAADALKVQKLIKGDVFNSYGPTENGITSTQYCLPQGAKSEQFVQGLSIGHSIPNSGAYVMDTKQRVVPVGVVGELVVTGDGLARGYTDSALDKDRFVEVEIEGETVRGYRTGDAARYNAATAELDFFGRLDYQVKIRGHRIELPEIEHVINEHHLVKDAVVLLRQNGEDKDPDMVSFVTVKDDIDDVSSGDENSQNGENDKAQVWGDLWDTNAYEELENLEPEKLGRDFAGWTSGYDGSVINPKEMQEWLDETIDCIHTVSNGPLGNVLEIGTGSGMILFNLGVDNFQSYFGLDPSPRAVDFVSKAAKTIPGLAEKIQVHVGAASNLMDLHEKMQSPNLVVINSVIQYFPTAQYLLQTIKDLLHMPSTETIFFGDVRSHALRAPYHATKALCQLGDSATPEEFAQRIDKDKEKEEELLLDPGFFTSLIEQFPDLVYHVEILPHRLESTNELSSYRYTAVLHLKRDGKQTKQEIRKVNEQRWVDFSQDKLDRKDLVHLLESASVDRDGVTVTAVSNIPDNKTILEQHMVDAINGRTEDTADDKGSWIVDARQKAKSTPAISPLELAEIAKSAGMQVEISWARQHSQRGGLDAIFYRDDVMKTKNQRPWFDFPFDHAGRQRQSMSNRPLQKQEDQKLVGAIRDAIQAQLPPYMMPTVIRILDKMPLNPSGKVDRIALKKTVAKGLEPNTEDASPSGKVSPRTETETTIRGLWSQTLGVSEDEIGINDHFFRLGGNSLRTVSLGKLIQQTFGVNVGLGLLNSKQATVSGIAAAIEQMKGTDVQDNAGLGPRVDLAEEVEKLRKNLNLPDSSQWKEAGSQRGSLKQDSHVFLTGGTGYLGSYILKQLVQHPDISKVSVLVRASDASQGLTRLKEAGQRLKWWREEYENKIQVWIGDLSSQHFGLTADQWQTLGSQVDAIVHNGARVDFVADYATLKKSNVDSTAQLIQVSIDSPVHPRLVFVSGGPKYSLSAWKQYAEDMAQDIGYSQSKIVSELLIHECATYLNGLCSADPDGTLLSTVKPGYIIGTPSEGIANTDDFLWRMVAGAAGLGAYPAESPSRWMYIADGAAVADSICRQLTLNAPTILVEVDSGVNPVGFWQIVMSELQQEDQTGSSGSRKFLHWDDWAGRMQQEIERVGEQHPLWPVQHILGKVSQPGKITFDDEETGSGGADRVQGGIEWKLKDVDAAIRRNVRYLADLGFIPTQPGHYNYDAGKDVFVRSKKELEAY